MSDDNKQTNIKHAELYFREFKTSDIDNFYKMKFEVWRYENSNEVNVNGTVYQNTGFDRFQKLMLKYPKNDKGEPNIKEYEVSGIDSNGAALTQQRFIKHEQREYERILSFLVGDDTQINHWLYERIEMYLEYLNKKLLIIDKPDPTDRPAGLITLKKEAQTELLFNNLKDDEYIPEDTDPKHFNYVFSGGNKPINYKQLTWTGSSQALCIHMIKSIFKTDADMNWWPAKQFGIKNPDKGYNRYKTNNTFNNPDRTGRPKYYENINRILERSNIKIQEY